MIQGQKFECGKFELLKFDDFELPTRNFGLKMRKSIVEKKEICCGFEVRTTISPLFLMHCWYLDRPPKLLHPAHPKMKKKTKKRKKFHWKNRRNSKRWRHPQINWKTVILYPLISNVSAETSWGCVLFSNQVAVQTFQEDVRYKLTIELRRSILRNAQASNWHIPEHLSTRNRFPRKKKRAKSSQYPFPLLIKRV